MAQTTRAETTTAPAEVLDLSEAAAYLRLAESDLLDLVREQGLPGRQVGDQWRFLKAGLRHWLCSPPLQQEALMELAGVWKDDPYLDDMLENIYEQRGRPMTEEDEA
jgi:excisionase family DNA binding protein